MTEDISANDPGATGELLADENLTEDIASHMEGLTAYTMFPHGLPEMSETEIQEAIDDLAETYDPKAWKITEEDEAQLVPSPFPWPDDQRSAVETFHRRLTTLIYNNALIAVFLQNPPMMQPILVYSPWKVAFFGAFNATEALTRQTFSRSIQILRWCPLSFAIPTWPGSMEA